ncbi:MAG: DUF4064 domain-containing protein [Candidatus Methanomethylophilaceae archaeon]|nr:DUF4064 domain-containing protein [Candidatus Methanomethylophilaceae archaeon]
MTNEKRMTRFMSVAIAAMFVFCACIVCIEGSSAVYYNEADVTTGANQVYNIDISTGYNFEYSVASNLDSETAGSVAYSASSLAGFTFANQKLTGSLAAGTTEGEYPITITATWTSNNSSGNGVITQTATQKIIFHVHSAIELNGGSPTANAYVLADAASGSEVTKIAYTAAAGATNSYTYSTNGLFAAADGTGANAGYIVISTARALTSADVGSYTITLTKSLASTGDSDTVTLTVYVFDTVAITNAGKTYYTYEGNTGLTSIDVQTNYESDNDARTELSSRTVSFDANNTMGEGAVMSFAGNNATTIAVATPAAGYVSSGTSKTTTATVTVGGSVTPEVGDTPMTSTSTGSVTVKVFKSLAFTSAPTASTAVITGIAGSLQNIHVSQYVEGAKTICFNWGDGTTTGDMDVGVNDSGNYAATHNYRNAGKYLITITAKNDMGSTTTQVLYNAESDNPIQEIFDEAKEKTQNFIDEHGWIFIIFAVIAAALGIAFVFFGYRDPKVIGAIVICVILAVIFYQHVDFNGVQEWIKGFFTE